MAIDDGPDFDASVDTPGSFDGAEAEASDVRERRETTETVTDSYVTLTRRVIRVDPDDASD